MPDPLPAGDPGRVRKANPVARKKATPQAPAAAANAGVRKRARELLDAVAKQLFPDLGTTNLYGKKIEKAPAGRAILALDLPTQAVVVSVALDRLAGVEQKLAAYDAASTEETFDVRKHSRLWNPRYLLLEIVRALLRRALPLAEEDVTRLLRWPVESPWVGDAYGVNPFAFPLSGMVAAAKHCAKANGVSPALAAALRALVRRLRKNTRDRECPQTADRLQRLLRDAPEAGRSAPRRSRREARLQDPPRRR